MRRLFACLALASTPALGVPPNACEVLSLEDVSSIAERPAWRRVPYATPVRGLFLCSSSTPPGGGVHGMCGHHAAQAALRSLR